MQVLALSSFDLVVEAHERANVLVTETLDSELLGEGTLSTTCLRRASRVRSQLNARVSYAGVLPLLRDAHKRLLTPDAVVIPSRARIWGQLFECTDLYMAHVVDAQIMLPNGSFAYLGPHGQTCSVCGVLFFESVAVVTLHLSPFRA